LDTAAADRAAREIGTIIRQPNSDVIRWPYLSTALAAVCRRLPDVDAAAHVNRPVDFIIAARDAAKEMGKSQSPFQAQAPAQALGALCGRLDAARASRAAGVIIAILGGAQTVDGVKYEFISYAHLVSVLTELAERPDAPGPAGGRGPGPRAAEVVGKHR
jgi:hypothetical protein